MMHLTTIAVVLCALATLLDQTEGFLGRKATCFMQPDPNASQKVTGIITLKQWSPLHPVIVSLNMKGIHGMEKMKGFHVHEHGNIAGGCKSTGGHFNPYRRNHGGPPNFFWMRHVGDLGNVRQAASGKINMRIIDRVISLYGRRSVIGRAMVLHAGEDDLGKGGNAGSRATGNAGSRLSCCVVGLS